MRGAPASVAQRAQLLEVMGAMAAMVVPAAMVAQADGAPKVGSVRLVRQAGPVEQARLRYLPAIPRWKSFKGQTFWAVLAVEVALAAMVATAAMVAVAAMAEMAAAAGMAGMAALAEQVT